jgi:hypothetical protein
VSTRGTIGTIATTPTASSRKPARISAAGRRRPARFPASSAMKNIVSDSGASDKPACSAL